MHTSSPPLAIAAYFPALAGSEKITVRLHPQPASDVDISASKLGGQFLWPADEPWPQCTMLEELPVALSVQRMLRPSLDGSFDLDPVAAGHELHNDYFVPVLQLRETDVPELGFYPGTDLFQLMWCPRQHPEQYAPCCRIFWRRASSVTVPRLAAPAPSWPDGELVPPQHVLFPERVVEYPSLAELPEELEDRLHIWEADEAAHGVSYQYQLSVAPGTKVGGYAGWHNEPEWPACPTCDARMDCLLTVASGEGGGTPEADARWYGNQSVGEQYLRIGDGGQLTIFICRRHTDWPIAWVHQA